MELVYLWVKDYKNIHKQGFNFSSRFECNYNYDANELTIDKNNNYIPDFFGKNINVTAIVGKNGSGKSSIAEVVSIFSWKEFLDEETFLVFFNGKEFSFKQGYTNSDFKYQISNKTKYKHQNTSIARTISTLYFGNELSTIFNNPKMENIKLYNGNINTFQDKTKDLESLKYPRMNKEKIDKFEIFNNRFHFILNHNKNILKNLDKILIFDRYRKELHFYEMISLIASDKNIQKLVEYKEDKRKTIFEENASLSATTNIENLLYKLLIIFRLSQYEKNLNKITERIFENFIDKDFSKKSFLDIFEIINEYDNQYKIYSEKNVYDILSSYNYVDNEIWIENNLTHIDVGLEIANPLLKLLKTNNIVRIEFLNSLDDNFTYFSLSSGERNYIEIFVTYIHQLLSQKKIQRKNIFFFDEIDLGLHPSWQKRLIKDIIFYANEYFEYSIHLIFTTHSPFLLSDIPKQNIIFLDTDDESKCKVVDGLKEKQQTFGANIHTLLSDSFFMKGGLMGEFAKSKINEIIDFHKEVEKENKKEQSNFTSLKIRYEEYKIKFWQVQSIIGEEYLKQVIKNHLRDIENILLGHNQAKKEEINRLREEADRLENM